MGDGGPALPAILLDITRLLRRAPGAPTGIDRVEQAYAEHLLQRVPERLDFMVVDRFDRPHLLPRPAAAAFVRAVGASWWDLGGAAGLAGMARSLWWRAQWPGRRFAPPAQTPPLYLLTSHQHLHRRRRIERVLAVTGARLVAFVHDMIPIDYPEYAGPGQTGRHAARMQTVAGCAEAVIVNSHVTAAGFTPYLRAAGRRPPVLVAHLGVTPRPAPAHADGPPFFVYISTVEPRKNHLLLLHVWRVLAQRHGPATPRLVLIGRRGWENENIIDLLERSPSIMRFVSQHGNVLDGAVAPLLRDCRALLFPSFAEGFGLPVAEALAAGTPVICSDLPVLREIGGSAPDYLDPLDGMAWLGAIEAYSAAGSSPRTAQYGRIQSWQIPSWNVHFDAVLAFLAGFDG